MNAPTDGRELSARLRPWLHRYLSTACRHHPEIPWRRCRITCKFCGAKCRCWCHDRRLWRHPLKYLAYRLRGWWTRYAG